MSEPIKPKARDPLAADNAFDKRAGTQRWAWLYALIAVGAAAAAAVMHMQFGVGLMEMQVLFPSLGAVWFGFRALYAFMGIRR